MSHRYFEGKVHALMYRKYRPLPPPPLIHRIISYLREKPVGDLELAYDIGCGSGQSTTFLAPYFRKVIGTDISKSMIGQAMQSNKIANVNYKISQAERIPATDNSVQLIASSQAAHWFDLNEFYKEGNRVLCPFGVIAIFGYAFPTLIAQEGDNDSVAKTKNVLLNKALDDIYRVDLKGCWAEERKLLDGRYMDIVIPYDDFVRDDRFYHQMETTVADIGNYIFTWQGVQTYVSRHGEEQGKKLITQFQSRLMEIMNSATDPETTKIINRTSYFLLMGRKSSKRF